MKPATWIWIALSGLVLFSCSQAPSKQTGRYHFQIFDNDRGLAIFDTATGQLWLSSIRNITNGTLHNGWLVFPNPTE